MTAFEDVCNEGRIKCASLNNRICPARPILVDVNFNETILYPLPVSVNESGGGCNTIDDPYDRLYETRFLL